MKKRIILLMIFSGFLASIYAQDTLTYMNGKTMFVKVLEVTDDQVEFNFNDDGSSFFIETKELFMIAYESGERFRIDHNKEDEVIGYNTYRYSGPKFGMTVLGQGKGAHFLKERGYETPLITQFGWQLETRLFTLENQTTGLLEWIFLAGGIEKGLFLPSASMIFGLRSGRNGLEVGVGPNLSVSGFGMAFAAGGSIPYDRINIPINVAFIPSINKNGFLDTPETPRATGFRLSVLVGFNTRVE